MNPLLVAYIGLILQVAFASIAGIGCVAAWRSSRRTWAPLGIVLGLGIAVRAWSGLVLFAISYWNLPFLSSVHMGDGFWDLAPDARVYFGLASTAAQGAAVPAGSPSPSFLRVFGLWIRATGFSPATAVLFNLALYVGSAVMLIRAFKPLKDAAGRRAALLVLSIFSFSPVLILLSTQSLKDVFSVFLIIMAAVSLRALLSATANATLNSRAIVATLSLALAVFLMAGVRTYYAAFMWVAAAAAFAVALVMLPRRAALRSAPFATAALALLWCAFMWGAGPYYAFYGNIVTRTIGIHLPLISPDANDVAALPPSEGFGADAARSSVQRLRRGFVNSGGATNLTSKNTGDSGSDEVVAVLTGLAAVFLPISALRQLSLVEFSGGRGFLLVTDLDTIFLDVALFAVAWMLVSSRKPLREHLPFLCFALGLGIVTALLVGYVVTNYGTVFRLRLLAAVPMWMLPLALRHAAEVSRREQTGADASRDGKLMASHEAEPVHSPGAA